MSKIRITGLDSENRVVVLEPTPEFQSPADNNVLYQTVENLVKLKKIELHLDLQNIPRPNNSFIALLIELASMVNRHNGRFLLINVAESAKMNLASFTPFSVLSLEKGGEKENMNSIEAVSAGDSMQPGYHLDENYDVTAFSEPDPSKDHNEKNQESREASDFDLADMIVDTPQPRATASERIVINSKEDQLYRLTDFVAIHAQQAGFSPTEISRIKISVYEAAHNIIEHAYEFDDKRHIEMNVRYDQHEFKIQLIDRGRSFDYDPDKDYDAVEAAEERRTGGFGLHIIRRSMDEVRYETNPVWGNRLTMVKKIVQ